MQIPLMKRTTFLLIAILLFTIARSQDMGFRTTDIGAEYQWYPHGTIYNLHVAFNAKLNHSIQVRLGYNHVPAYDAGDHTEFGKGWGGGLGYRYYFKPFPYKFFIGARADVWVMKIDKVYSFFDFSSVQNNYLILQPALEAGYTFVINDILYITPYAAAGFQTDFSQSPSVNYGNGFVPTAG